MYTRMPAQGTAPDDLWVLMDEARADDISPPRLINLDLAVNEEAYYGPHAILDPARRLSSSAASVAMRTDRGMTRARHAPRTLARLPASAPACSVPVAPYCALGRRGRNGIWVYWHSFDPDEYEPPTSGRRPQATASPFSD